MEPTDPWKALLQKVEAKKPTTPAAWPARATTRTYAFEKPELREKIMEMAADGCPPKDCAAACGVKLAAFKGWRDKALAGEEPFRAFFEELDVASAKAKAALIDDIRKAGRGTPDHNGIWKNNWKASAYLLEKQYPEEFIERKKIEVTSVVRPSIDPRRLSDEELAQLEELYAKGAITEGQTADDDSEALRLISAEVVEE